MGCYGASIQNIPENAIRDWNGGKSGEYSGWKPERGKAEGAKPQFRLTAGTLRKNRAEGDGAGLATLWLEP
jgi:hypothetical protein